MTKLNLSGEYRPGPNYDSRFEPRSVDEFFGVCPVCSYSGWYSMRRFTPKSLPNCPECIKMAELQKKAYSVIYASNEVFLK